MNFETYITIIVIILFLYLVFKTRISPFINKIRKKGEKDNATAVSGRDTPVETSMQACIKRIHYEVLAFNENESDNSVLFRERINMHLSRITTELTDKGADYSLKFVPLSDTLVVIVSYEL